MYAVEVLEQHVEVAHLAQRAGHVAQLAHVAALRRLGR